METQLQILDSLGCTDSSIQDSGLSSPHDNTTPIWYGSTLQGFFNKIREIAKPEKPDHVIANDNWDIPFERIHISREDYHRCGSQGDVFYGRLNHSPVAVKRVKDRSLTNIKHLRDLDDKNVIKFKGISQDSNFYYILMEWCPHGTLHNLIHNGRQLSTRILGNWIHQIGSGMRYLHSRNIIHRDLKPSNILITRDDVLKISDFGTHKLFRDTTSSDSCAGTYAYMAPEMIRSEPHSFPVDVWSFGIVLWEILTGEEPYKNFDSSAILWAVGMNSFKLPVPESLPQGFLRILMDCWKQPSDRLTFTKICIILRGARREFEKIPNQRWFPLQAEWKRYIIAELKNYLEPKSEWYVKEASRQKAQALDEKYAEVVARRDKLNHLYLQVQESAMLVQRDREQVEREREQLKADRQDLIRREQQLKLDRQKFEQEQQTQHMRIL